ncbi:TauD/TfdA family dioxygenase [Glutamicibacter protophormiae]|uniref:TauD/TfdA family dioxygenase n=1 Tax=Glutamicibacter protophormiae TaxID=37930 RepID=UPI003A8FAAF2
MNIKDLWSAAKETGWAMESWTDVNPCVNIQYLAKLAGWIPVGTRAGEGPVSNLRPVSQSEARAKTMSSVYGLQSQPLHVDGSHMLRPPDIIVLFSAEPSTTPTRIWKPTPNEIDRDAACHGLFLIGTGRSAFLAPLAETMGKDWKYRYDPVIMKPADDRARAVAKFFDEESNQKSIQIKWKEPNMLLLIHNRRVLHGRGAVADTDHDRTLLRMAFYTGENS